MIKIIPATTNDFKTIIDIVYKTWPICYAEIITTAQMYFMLEKYYNEEALTINYNSGHQFLLAKENEVCMGFAAYEHNYKNENKTRLHKIYMLPESQGKGIGLKLMQKVEDLAFKNKSVAVSLNVNKYNKAQDFYKKIGYQVVADEVIDIGYGYVMDDFRMEKNYN